MGRTQWVGRGLLLRKSTALRRSRSLQMSRERGPPSLMTQMESSRWVTTALAESVQLGEGRYVCGVTDHSKLTFSPSCLSYTNQFLPSCCHVLKGKGSQRSFGIQKEESQRVRTQLFLKLKDTEMSSQCPKPTFQPMTFHWFSRAGPYSPLEATKR